MRIQAWNALIVGAVTCEHIAQKRRMEDINGSENAGIVARKSLLLRTKESETQILTI